MKLSNMKYVFIFFALTTKVCPFINHMFEFYFFQKMVIEMLFNKKLKYFSFEMNLHFEIFLYICVHY